MIWLRWFERLLLCAERSAKRVPQGTRARRLSAEATRQWDAWYRSSRHSGSRLSPEDYPDLRRRLRAVQADTSQPMGQPT